MAPLTPSQKRALETQGIDRTPNRLSRLLAYFATLMASIGATLNPRRQMRALRQDDGAETNVGSAILSLVISAMLLGFVGFLLFGILAPDVTTVCDADNIANGTSSQEECDNAKDARGLLITLILVGIVAIMMAVLAVVTTVARRGLGGGGRRSR